VREKNLSQGLFCKRHGVRKDLDFRAFVQTFFSHKIAILRESPIDNTMNDSEQTVQGKIETKN